jgi:KDO2-lipid IV(A) lauroyltransferase
VGHRTTTTTTTDRLLLAAWSVVPRLPAPLAYGLFALAADLAWWRRGAGVRQLEATLARVRPGAGPQELRELSRAGMRSYLRYWCDTFTLPTWSRERLVTTVRVEGLEPLAAVLEQGRGAVLFLGHLGNWDHLGAWTAQQVMPVTTVAERLEPAAVFDAFVAHRRQLGITTLPLTGGGSFTHLVRVLSRGGLVPLLADRDLTGTGVEVELFGETARMAAGPAALALATGSPLFAVTCHHERSGPWWRTPSHTLVGEVHEVPVPDREAAGGRAGQVAAMTRACAAHLERAIGAHPQDWHVLAPVFLADQAVPA